MNPDEREHLSSLTENVLGAVFEVSNTLGAGFLEKVYELALLKELAICGIRAKAQASFPVIYKRWKRIVEGFDYTTTSLPTPSA